MACRRTHYSGIFFSVLHSACDVKAESLGVVDSLVAACQHPQRWVCDFSRMVWAEHLG